MRPGRARSLVWIVLACLHGWWQTALPIACVPAFAGHGFMTAFGDVEWLPDAGRTPDQFGYALDSWHEAGQLWLADTPRQVVELTVGFAREKLAEAEVMVGAQDTAAARVAVEHYWDYVGRAEQAVLSTPHVPDTAGGAHTAELIEMLATDLLEQQYILTVLYTELPAASRSVMHDLLIGVQQRYATIAERLSRKKRGALFFKEAEVRWSIEMALRPDETAG